MKFALKIRKFYTISILASLVAMSGLKAQQFSYLIDHHVFSLNRYTFPRQLGIEKIYSISQNNLGTLFLTTNKGVILFDGIKWDRVNFNQKAFIASNSVTLFLFSQNFTGKIIKESSGNYLVKEIEINYPFKDWQPDQTICFKNSVFLIGNNAVWQFIDNRFKMLLNNISNAKLELKKDELYLITEKDNFEFHLGKFIPAITSYTPAEQNVQRFGCDEISLPAKEVNQLIFNDTRSNLKNDSISTTYCDWNNNLWLLSSKALYCLKNAKYLQTLIDVPFPMEQMKSILEDSNETLALTTTEILSFSSGTIKRQPFSGQQLTRVGLRTFISGNDGIYIWQEGKPKKIISRPISYATRFQEKLLFVSKGILFSLGYVNNAVSVKELFSLKNDSIKKIIGQKNGDLWILDNLTKICLLTGRNNGYKCETIFDPSQNNKMPFVDNIFLINDEVFASNAFEIYKLKGKDLIEQDWIFKNLSTKGGFINNLEADSLGNILFSTTFPGQKKEIYYGRIKGHYNYDWYELPIWEAGLKSPQILSWYDNKIILSGEDKIYSFNLSNFFDQKQKVVLSVDKIKVNDQICALSFRKKGKTEIPYFEVRHPGDLITIKFQTVDLLNPGNIQYSFLLENGEKDWSAWTPSPERYFLNLSPGDYRIKVKAQAINGNESDVYTIHFKVFPPMFMQWFAWFSYAIILIGIVGFVGLRRKKQFEKEKITLEKIIQERTSELVREKEKTDELLANMLPKDTADELKLTGKASSHKFDMVTVLFSDIQGFTKIAEQMNPEKLIDELDNFFFQFDSVVEKYNIEKIKTIGDAYMAAGGIPYKNRTNPVEVVLAALEMQEYMKTLKIKNSDIWDLRIGVHTGAVIAGVVGHKRISYDIWGDTVNTASRMESSGEASKINISGHTYELVKEFFICEYRGKMPVKYKGDIDMYFVKGIRPELSINLRSIPNKKFFIQLQLLRIQDLEEFIFNKLEAELPLKYSFHNLKHTKDVYTQAELLGRAENVSPEEMLLIRTAALLHDTGYIYTYQNHETKSLDICKEILPKFKYSNDQIETICNLILCTKKNAKPTNILEEILIDANSDYLGRIDYIQMSLNLYHESRAFNNSKSESEWFASQAKLIEGHEYFTETARKLREVTQMEQIRKIKDYLKLYV
jgi:adenylate cyclase